PTGARPAVRPVADRPPPSTTWSPSDMRAFAIAVGVALVGAMAFTVLSFVAAPTPAPVAAAPFRETPQERLRRLPNDHRGWAELGIQYVDQARITGDPSYYSSATCPQPSGPWTG
ncbi:hypothetical protein, partial [Nonomuraea terrae]